MTEARQLEPSGVLRRVTRWLIVACMTHLIGTAQVARQLGVYRSTVHRWVLDGRLTPAQVISLSTPDLDDDGTAAEGPKVYLFDAEYIASLNPFRIRRRHAAAEPQTGTDN